MSADRISSRATAEALIALPTMDCSGIERKLKKLSGVKHVTVDYVARTVLINYDPARLTAEQIRNFLKRSAHDAANHKQKRRTYRLLRRKFKKLVSIPASSGPRRIQGRTWSRPVSRLYS